MRKPYLQTLLLSGLAGAAPGLLGSAISTSGISWAQVAPGIAGALCVTLAGFLGNMANSQRDAKLSDVERRARADRNHQLRRGMAAALRRGLKRCQIQHPSLPSDPYESLFVDCEHRLREIEANDEELARYFPEQLTDSLLEAANSYGEDRNRDVEALAQLMQDLSRYMLWNEAQAREFAATALPFFRQAFADDLAGDSGGPLFQAFIVKGENQIHGLVLRFITENKELHAKTHGMLVELLERIQPLTTSGAFSVLNRRSGAKRRSLDKAGFEFMRRVDKVMVGRQQYLNTLDEAWTDRHVGIVCIVAFGGVGKTSLAVNWQRTHLPHDTPLLCYSFYNQGTTGRTQITSEPFVDYALREWFGVSEPQLDIWRRGVILADLIKSEPTVVILDGLEPLQTGSPPNVKLEDYGVSGLLCELGCDNPGLCICTSRQPLNDLEKTCRGMLTICLEDLTPDAGAEYLELLGAHGLEEELREASIEFGNHALALTLLGKYISTECDGDIRRRDTIPHLIQEPEQGQHARRVLKGYESLLSGRPELSIMRMLGLFDRPAEPGALMALKDANIPGLSAGFDLGVGSSWRGCLKSLGILRLVQYTDPEGIIDCHPLVRSYFGEVLRTENYGATWRHAHRELYRFFESQAKDYPENAHDMEPLYSAVIHACHAGDYRNGWETYWQRIQRGHPTYYNTNALGGFQSGLTMLAAFFEHPWSAVADTVKDTLGNRSYCKMLEEVGFHLKGVGRFDEAIAVMRRALAEYANEGDFGHATVNSENIGETLGFEGRFTAALPYLDPATYADKSGDMFRRMSTLSARGEVLHRMAEYGDAEKAFAEAEDIRERNFPDRFPVRSLYYLDLLSDLRRYEEFEKLAARFRPLLNEDKAKLFAGVYYMFAGCAGTRRIISGMKEDIGEVLEYLRKAVRLIDESRAQHFQPRTPCIRARLFIHLGRLEEAKADLDKALLISKRGRLVIHEADAHLGLCEWYIRSQLYDQARSEFEAGEPIVRRTNYRRQESWCTQLCTNLETERI